MIFESYKVMNDFSLPPNSSLRITKRTWTSITFYAKKKKSPQELAFYCPVEISRLRPENPLITLQLLTKTDHLICFMIFVCVVIRRGGGKRRKKHDTNSQPTSGSRPLTPGGGGGGVKG